MPKWCSQTVPTLFLAETSPQNAETWKEETGAEAASVAQPKHYGREGEVARRLGHY